jgi:adenylosuccinate synthase
MKRAIITVGLGFGDEGKGATVDFLARRYEADLVVRYCGGSQAGHNVELPDGRRHTFAQFGAGTLSRPVDPPRTYLGPNVIIDPPALAREAAHLVELGVPAPTRLLTVHPHCLVTTPWLKLLNRLREAARGNAKHGSCGQGMGETRHYWLRYGADAVVATDLRQPDVLRHKLELQRQRVLLEVQEFLDRIDADFLEELEVGNLDTGTGAVELSEAMPAEVSLDAAVPDYHLAIFEGAQGVLLDEYRGFHPHTTWSTVTPQHAWELVHAMGVEAVAVLGITRAYTTRHGHGPLPTFDEELTTRLRDAGNPWNRWQGGLRSGWLDLPLLRYAAAVTGPLDGIVVNHLDQVFATGSRVCEAYRNADLYPSRVPHLAWQSRLTERLLRAEPVLAPTTADDIIRRVSEIAPVVVKGYGPAHGARESGPLSFRKRTVI